MKKLFCILLILTLIAALFAGCKTAGTVAPPDGGEAPVPVTGLYQAVEAIGAPEEFDCSSVTLNMKEDGTAVLSSDGSELIGTWTLNGSTVTLTLNGKSVSGTLENGEITLLDDGEGIRFVHTGNQGSAAQTPAGSGASMADAAGLYMIQSLNGETLGHASDITLQLNADGSAVFTAYGESENGSWALDGENVTVTISGTPIHGTLRNGELYLAAGGESMRFGYAGSGAGVHSGTGTAQPEYSFYGEYRLQSWNGRNISEILHDYALQNGVSDEEMLEMLDPYTSMDELEDLITVIFREDGTYLLIMGSDSQDGLFEWDGSVLTMDPDTYPTYGTWVNGVITISNEDEEMVFVHK